MLQFLTMQSNVLYLHALYNEAIIYILHRIFLLSDFSVSLESFSPNVKSGIVVVTYLEVEGNICSDGWDHTDAGVFCKQQGFEFGSAYNHTEFSFFANRGPIWISEVHLNVKFHYINLMISYTQFKYILQTVILCINCFDSLFFSYPLFKPCLFSYQILDQ